MTSAAPSLLKRVIPFGILGGLAILLISLDVRAQSGAKSAPDAKQAEAKAQDAAKRTSVVREGFTRPGNPPDEVLPNGKIRYVAWDPANKEDVIGGTIYWMVLRRTGSDTDPWGTGITKFTESFREGKDFENRYSPSLDTDAQYLYLYQAVNDRGLDPLPIKPAANTEIPTKPIARTSLRLLVEPREITSWGYFKDLAFAADVADRKFDGTSAAGLGQPDKMIRMAVSSNPSILAELPHEPYLAGSPPYPLGDLRQTFSIGPSTIGLASSWAAKELKTNAIKYASWAKNELQAVENALAPDYVLITVAGYDWPRRDAQNGARQAALEWGENEAQFVFQTYWDKDNIKLGQHTTIFGFTCNLPPVDEELRIADPAALKLAAAGIRLTANDGDVVPVAAEAIAAGGMASGTAPTPAGAAAPTGFAGPMGSIGGMTPGGGGGGGGGPGFGGGGFAGGFGSFSGGFGSGFPGSGVSGSSSNSTPTQTQQVKQQQNQQESQTESQQENQQVSPNQQSLPPGTPPVTVNINQTITQNQQQTQQQQQQQQQTQTQTQTGTTPSIPEPAAIVLAVAAVPVLFFCWRRRLHWRKSNVAA
jgi:hypothetical protein